MTRMTTRLPGPDVLPGCRWFVPFIVVFGVQDIRSGAGRPPRYCFSGVWWNPVTDTSMVFVWRPYGVIYINQHPLIGVCSGGGQKLLVIGVFYLKIFYS